MFLLSFIPDAWLHLAVISVLFTGIGLYAISFFTRFVPPLIPYSGIVRIVGTALIVAGIYFYGSYSTEISWRNRVAELEEQVRVAEAKSKDVNYQIQKVYIDRVKVVKDSQVVIQEKIKEVEKQVDAECKVDPSVIKILNDAGKRVSK